MVATAEELVARFSLKRAGREWRGTCPLCGYGVGAFALFTTRTGKPMLWCSSCQDRVAMKRLMGGDFLISGSLAHVARIANRKAWLAERALSQWRGSMPAVDTPVDAYLTRRGLLELAASTAVRFCPDCPHPNGGRLPAMVAAVTNTMGAVVAVHRTFLTLDGSKASVEPVKASLGPVWGGVIRLNAHDPNKLLVIGEGIETASAAGCLMNLPAWAAISAGNLAKGLVLPRDVRRLVIAADPDEPGRVAARDVWLRWSAEGRAVRIATPTKAGDFNDLLLGRKVDHAA